MGNPLKYRGWDCVWGKGRQLQSISDNTNTVEFTYDVSGMRAVKTVGGEITNYVYESGKLLREYTNDETIDYIYGRDGIIGFKTKDDNYLYRKNLFGDIIEIYKASGELVGKYSYTAFGKCSIEVDEGGIATKNPFRYRSYYYDETLDLYYLQTRYYDPEVGRFITIDGIEYIDPESINGLNLYAYCGNNPVMRTDPNGTSWWTDFWGGIGDWFVNIGNSIWNGIINIGSATTGFIGGSIDGVEDGISALLTGRNVGLGILSGISIGSVLGQNLVNPLLSTKNNKKQNTTRRKMAFATSYVTQTSVFMALSQLIDGGPRVDLDANGWGENGEFTLFQKSMGILASVCAGIGFLGVIMTLVFPPAGVVGVPMFGIGFALSIFSWFLADLVERIKMKVVL